MTNVTRVSRRSVIWIGASWSVQRSAFSRILIEVHTVATGFVILDELEVVCTQTKWLQNAIAQTLELAHHGRGNKRAHPARHRK